MNQSVLRVGGVPEHFNLPWHLACEQNLFARINANVRFIDYEGGTGQLTAALEDGELEIAILLFEGALQKILNGGSYRIVKLFTDTALIWGMHVANGSPMHSVEEANRKRFAISRFGSGSHLIAIVDAAERGWSTDDMNFVKIGNLEGARASLAAGESDVLLWEWFMTKPLVDSGEFRRIDERIAPWPAFVVAVRDDVLERESETVFEVLKLAAECCVRLKNDPAAAQVIAGRYQLLPVDAQSWLDRTEWNNDFVFPAESFETVFNCLEMLKLLEKPQVDCRSAWFQLGP